MEKIWKMVADLSKLLQEHIDDSPKRSPKNPEPHLKQSSITFFSQGQRPWCNSKIETEQQISKISMGEFQDENHFWP